MKISIFGLGYVGCVTAACLAHDGHQVIGVEVNPHKLTLLQAGCSPIAEPGLDALIAEVVQAGTLQLTSESAVAVQHSDLSLICVGTPSDSTGRPNLHYVTTVAREIGQALAMKASYHTVVVRSTVLPGTVEATVLPLLAETSGQQVGVGFGLCMHPEFLRESSAIHDYYHPSFIVIGEYDRRSGDMVEHLYQAIDAPIYRTAIAVAELLKFACNAFHATKVVFANEMGTLCKAHGIDGQHLMALFCQDQQLNLSAAYLRPGFAFGGSCLPKDVRALVHRAKACDLETPLLNALLPSNQQQIARALRLVEQAGGKRVGVLGLSFKAGTDDVRESPTVALIETLLGKGYHLRIFDDQIKVEELLGANKSFLEREIPHIFTLMCASLEAVVAESEVIVIANGSARFRSVPPLLGAQQTLIDLVGTARERESHGGAYEGLCW
jgi:GDP-mannose 6-dehydrogenase